MKLYHAMKPKKRRKAKKQAKPDEVFNGFNPSPAKPPSLFGI